ncbi:MAG: ABC transporter substrate-binding protein [Pseudomonadota bacterium]
MLEKLVKKLLFSMFAACLVIQPVNALDQPDVTIETTVQELLDEFTANKASLQGNKRELFALVDRIALPLFDFDRISKLVLAKNWKNASAQQRKDFALEFKRLLIGSYATALFQYTGKEKMVFTSTNIKEKKGKKFATVKSEVTLSSGPGIPVNYSLMLNENDQWKIYNMDIAGLNMVTSYRKTYGSTIRSKGVDGLIESMKLTNEKNYGS